MTSMRKWRCHVRGNDRRKGINPAASPSASYCLHIAKSKAYEAMERRDQRKEESDRDAC